MKNSISMLELIDINAQAVVKGGTTKAGEWWGAGAL
jgi:hypothetical protein